MNAQRTRVAFALALVMSVGIANAQTKIKPGFNLFSPQDDMQVGQQSAVEAERQLPILHDSTVEGYVNRIGQRLAANAGGPNFQYQFHVVNASDINAFALPGGFIYVNRGVLDNAHNEGEVAGVLAHEISHVALRHGTHQASKAYLAQAGISILGGILGGKVGQGAASIINTVGGIGLNALFLKYSRDLETQADIRGSQILAASGYSPVDMVNFFKTLESVDKSKKTNWLSDHPAPPGAVNGNDVIVGAIVNHYAPFGNARGLVESGTLEDATNDLIATLRQSSPYLRVASGSGQRVRMAGGTALAAALTGTDPNTGIAERVTVVTRQLSDEHLIYMLFITPERDASRYSSVLNAMVSSMQINDTRAH